MMLDREKYTRRDVKKLIKKSRFRVFEHGFQSIFSSKTATFIEGGFKIRAYDCN